jgi:lipid-binding SYLF domain-containing protein
MHIHNIQTISKLVMLLSCYFFFIGTSNASSKEEIDIEVSASLDKFKEEVLGAKKFMEKAEGVLVFPDVVKVGFGIGGEYGEGALLIKGKTVDYYNTAAASIGFQLGAQFKTVMLIFLKINALDNFRNSSGWEVGVDGSVALIELGAGKDINTINLEDPIVGFVFSNKGLMYNLTLEGSKISKMDK